MMHTTQNRFVAGSRKILALCVLVAALMAAMLLTTGPVHASTTFTVDSTGDYKDLSPGDGECHTGLVDECTLRAAIEEANATPGADTIEFDISTLGVATISPASELPKITRPVTINGYTQPGARPNAKAVGSDAVLKIELSGTGAPGADGLVLGSSNSTVKGLVFNRWYQGIRIDGAEATGNRITGNFLGTDASGTQNLGNYVGVRVYYGSNNTIGGTTPAERNVISANRYSGVSIGDGVVIRGNKVIGNYIGTDASGAKDLGNASYGVNVDSASNNVIGGATAGARNVISGNDVHGVAIASRETKVLGNYIGTDASGTKDLGNVGAGVYIDDANNVVGGTGVGERNVVSGNDFQGIHIFGAAATGNRVTGNFIGTDASGTKDLGNVEPGVYIDHAPHNVVGGTTVGGRNVVSANDSEGVLIVGPGAVGNKVMGNYVGTDKTGATPLGNASYGVNVIEAANNTVGGTEALPGRWWRGREHIRQRSN